MYQDKTIELLTDATDIETSECCDAKVLSGFCADCKEHC